MIAPNPSKKNIQRRNAGGDVKAIDNGQTDKLMTFEAKVCATLQCVWCATSFEDYSIRCRVCGNCQYCGMFCMNRNQCNNCGNELPVEFRIPDERPLVRFE